MRKTFFGLTILLAGASYGNAGQTLQTSDWTLKRCFELAIKHSETIAISDQAVRKAEAQLHRVLAKSLPEFSFHYSSLWQDQSGLSDTGGVNSSFTKSPSPEGSFRMKLPPLTGYRELAALKGGSFLVDQKQNERKRIELLLFNDVANAYYAVGLAEENLKTTEKVMTLTQERLKELQARERVGRSRKAEVLDLEAEIAVLESQKEDLGQTVKIARNLLEFLVGEQVGGMERDFASLPPAPIETYLVKIEERPDVKAKKDVVLVSQNAVRTTRADYFPGLDMTANYYTKRTGFRKDINWDINLGTTFPIWSWGAVKSSVDESKASLRQAEEDEKLTRRQAEHEIKDTYEELLSSLRKLKLQEKVLDLVNKSYESRVSEYRMGLVTNFEVLNALDRLHRSELALDAVRFESALDGLRLEIAAGSLPGNFGDYK